MFREEFINGVLDYRWLLEKKYPQRSAIHMVGNRYKLSGDERSMLYRGVSDSISAASRAGKYTSDLSAGTIAVDCYNVLFTIAHYFLGKTVYISDDGFLRDTGEGRGRISNKKVFEKATGLLKAFILSYRDKEFILLLDAPVSNSGQFAADLNGFLNLSGIKGNAETLNSPDHRLKQMSHAVVCSSDSAIVDKTSCPVFDLPFNILRKEYSPVFLSIKMFFDQQGQ